MGKYHTKTAVSIKYVMLSGLLTYSFKFKTADSLRNKASGGFNNKLLNRSLKWFVQKQIYSGTKHCSVALISSAPALLKLFVEKEQKHTQSCLKCNLSFYVIY